MYQGVTYMFCNEPIIAAYEGQREYNDIKNADAFFDCYYDLAYHVTKGYRIVLETEHYYISLASTGVTISDKNGSTEEFEEDGEFLDPFVHTDFCEQGYSPWVDYEATLFVGERLIDVQVCNGLFLLYFDHFNLKIVPHDLDEDTVPSLKNKDHWSYNHVYGLERFIRKKCACGGTGELLMDFVSDYVVRCKDCKKSTWAGVNAIDAIEDWEAGELHCELPDITIE